ncbi:hypothetical protein E2F43_18020 [Seongchinamella unica]|uniref:Uncharacterized protein n=1 Tax=Seongchinamella unica TaxID=2547392 RepID=A0A4R5LN31_9GAMM|nr:hypothetical protein [Seongchinamella unica]TDG11611.1 hypothetical protein E2F43_18020 [Seongchinamella unica]
MLGKSEIAWGQSEAMLESQSLFPSICKQMKTVYIHAGNLKTGSSALQAFCSRHRNWLGSRGINYLVSARPRRNHDTHSALPLSLLKELGCYTPLWYDDNVIFQDIAATVKTEINNSDLPGQLISSEEFYRFGTFSPKVQAKAIEQLQALFHGYDVRVILYIRGPMEFMVSWYKEVNEEPVPRPRFSKYFMKIPKAYLDPTSTASFLRQCFGDDALRVLPYTNSSTDHIQKFLQEIGVNDSPYREQERAIVNQSRPEYEIEPRRLARIVAQLPVEDREEFAQSSATDNGSTYSEFCRKIDSINLAFSEFCHAESLDLDYQPLNADEMLETEARLNSHKCKRPGFIAIARAKFETPSTRTRVWTIIDILGLSRLFQRMFNRTN